ncbi:MAG: hypothetical protein R3F39_09715 [Myxococcota bacterium]
MDSVGTPDLGDGSVDAGPDGHGGDLPLVLEIDGDGGGEQCAPSKCVKAGVSCSGNAQLSCTVGADGCFVAKETACLDADDEPVACDQFTGTCAASCTGKAPPSTPVGPLTLDLTEVAFASATVEVAHKRDVDAFEDGCIAGVTVRLTRAGCVMVARTHPKVVETDPDGHLVIQSLTFSADSACPGFPDAKEGSYSAQASTPWTLEGPNLGVLAFGTDRVPGQNVASSCFVSTLEIRLFPSVLRDGSKELGVLASTIALAGEFVSAGDVDHACPCAAQSDKGCGSDGGAVAVRWRDSCGRDNGLFDTCVGEEQCLGEGLATACVCPGHWEGAGCDVCPGGWDADQGCAVCRNEWTGPNCDICPGNYDADADCGSCRGGWTGESCETCPANFDATKDCSVCRNHWSGPSCTTCPTAVLADTDCSKCRIAWISSGPFTYEGCYGELRPYPLGTGVVAIPNGTALGDDGRLYVGTEGGVLAFDAEREPLWSVGGTRAVTADGGVYVQGYGGFSRLDPSGEELWYVGGIGYGVFGSPGLPAFDLQSRFWSAVELPDESLVYGTDGKAVTSYETIRQPASAYALDESGTIIYRPHRWDVPDADDPNTPWFEWAEGPRIQAVRVSDGFVLWELQRPTIQNDTHVQVSARAGGGVMIADTWGYLVVDSKGKEIFEPDGDPKTYSEMTVGEDGSVYAADSGRVRRWTAAGEPMWEKKMVATGTTRTPTIAADGSSYLAVDLSNGGKGVLALEANGESRWGFTAQATCSDPVIDDDKWLWTACGAWLFRLPASAKLADSVWPRYRGGNGNAGR